MRIIIGVDGSAASTLACEFVVSRPWLVGTSATLLAVRPEGHPTRASERELHEALNASADVIRRGPVSVECEVAEGAPAEQLMALASETDADLLVVGSRGLSPLEATVRRSVSAHLVDQASCPVLVARRQVATRILLAADGTPSSRDIPRRLAAWGNAFRGLPVEVLSVSGRGGQAVNGMDDLALHQGIAEDVADELMELGWHSAATARLGAPSHQIVEEGAAWRADLIVTGSRGIGTLRRLVAGSVSHDVLFHTDASVLVMRGRGFARAQVPDLVAAMGA